ncbi:hypothetical protein J2TS6_47370 [Paenibacillus albilobatus]|uniref:Uncharacterized protein n=1 Tax=Paenibacillus albilobatus TaxID=2716884 RepID=A0A920CBI4_9BACL|nr:hypothetical protein J2TS6_47370 [Paenibacillus albilobatus]
MRLAFLYARIGLRPRFQVSQACFSVVGGVLALRAAAAPLHADFANGRSLLYNGRNDAMDDARDGRLALIPFGKEFTDNR